MKKVAIFLMLLTIFTKLLGFSRDIALAYFYGVSSISDAYLISLTIPGIIFTLIVAGLSTAYIPMYSKIEKNYGENEGNKFTNNLLNILLIVSTVIVILGLSFTNQIVKVFASGFEEETLSLAVKFTQISLFGIYFSGLVYLFKGFLQLKGNYFIPELVGIPLNFFTILFMFISFNTNPIALAIGSVIGVASQLLLLLPFVYKQGFKYQLLLDIKDEHIKRMLYIACPVIIGVSVDQVNILVDRTLSSQIALGGISALNYASKLNGFIYGIFVLSISTVMYPMISKMATENDLAGLKKSILEAISGINLLVLPATIGAMIFSEPIVRLLFDRGAFDPQAIFMTSDALFFYSIGLVCLGHREVLSKAFFALQDTKTPMINAGVAVILNIILSIILSKFMGIGGLALGTSLSALFSTLLLFISLRKKIGPVGMINISTSLIKVLGASLIMGFIAKIVYNNLIHNLSSSLSLIISIAIGSVIYFITIYFMKIEDVNKLVKLIKLKTKKAPT